jgi:hypothetical protein
MNWLRLWGFSAVERLSVRASGNWYWSYDFEELRGNADYIGFSWMLEEAVGVLKCPCLCTVSLTGLPITNVPKISGLGLLLSDLCNIIDNSSLLSGIFISSSNTALTLY